MAAPKKKTWLNSGPLQPIQAFLVYLALRVWGTIINCFPVRANLVTARIFGRIWWWLMPRHRERAMENLRAALGDVYTEAELWQIARSSFEHFTQVYLVELLMTTRLVNHNAWSRHVELDDLGPGLQVLLEENALMVTPHFGNFELLGMTLTKLGVPLAAVMRPLDNVRMNRFLVESRAVNGLTLMDKKGAMTQTPELLDRGLPVCFIADQDAGRKGYFVDFFGRSASTYKSIALLAIQRDLPVIAGYAARVRTGFHYRIGIERIIRPDEWADRDNPALWITQEFSRAMERSIRRWPEQYLWVHRRWKTQPPPRKATRARTAAAKPAP